MLAPITANIVLDYVFEKKIPNKYCFFLPKDLICRNIFMFKENCIVNGANFHIIKIDFHLDDLLKKFVKDKKIKVAVAVNNQTNRKI